MYSLLHKNYHKAIETNQSSSNDFVDFIIVGQGLCGSLLSWYLIKAGKKVLVIDDPKPFTASKVASGIINPITGRRLVRTWRIEELLPFALEAYTQLGKECETSLIRSCNILDFYPSHQMKEAFTQRQPEEQEYLHQIENDGEWKTYFNYHFGLGQISPCLLVDMVQLLNASRQNLIRLGSYLQTRFSWDDCRVASSSIHFKNITAEKVICCEGVAGFTNPYFANLPYTRMKGEAIIASIPGLPRTHIYKQGISIVPWRDDLFWIGSTYEWSFEDMLPTPAYRTKVEAHLAYWLKLPFSIVDHIASERPANMERRPFVGLHPQHPAVGVFNGMGAKGCSLAPFFAKQFSDHLVNGLPIYADADVNRFKRMLAKEVNP